MSTWKIVLGHAIWSGVDLGPGLPSTLNDPSLFPKMIISTSEVF